MLRTEEFDYRLPEGLIAARPVPKRDESRLMLMDRSTNSIINTNFFKITDYLNEGDVIVLNDTKVIPARLLGKKTDGGGRVEVLLLRKIEKDKWECLVHPAKRIKKGYKIEFEKCGAEIIEEIDDSRRLVEFSCTDEFEELLDEIGQIPLPPYIAARLSDEEKNSQSLISRYQTVYASKEGATAAPTAGLHFTNELLQKIRENGVEAVYITLHTGIGTFRPVVSEAVSDHKMSEEEYEIREESAAVIQNAKERGGRIIAVGTTCVRCLEDCYLKHGKIKETKGDAEIFIYPPYKPKVVDCLITNFHFPRSTLLMLVCAFAEKQFVKKAYQEAIDRKYRFYSFGDAMMII